MYEGKLGSGATGVIFGAFTKFGTAIGCRGVGRVLSMGVLEIVSSAIGVVLLGFSGFSKFEWEDPAVSRLLMVSSPYNGVKAFYFRKNMRKSEKVSISSSPAVQNYL